MFFSIQSQGFYVGDDYDKDYMPTDCLEVSVAVEAKIREAVISGYNITRINGEDIDTIVAKSTE